MLKLIGQGNKVEDRAFTLKDSIGALTPSTIGLPDNWYGGMIKKMYKTKEGYLMCTDKKGNIVNIAYDDSNIPEPKPLFLESHPSQDNFGEGSLNSENLDNTMQMVAEFTPIQKGEIDYESMDVHELKEMAEKRRIEYFKNAKKDKMIELLKKGDNAGQM